MGCCLLACIGAIWPRFALVFIWIFFHRMYGAFETWYWPLLGLFFMPTTALAWMLCKYYSGMRIDESVVSIVIVAVAALHDLGQLGMLRGSKDEAKTPV